jgi:major cell surface glycoprotein (TIGR04216 family)
MADTLRLILLVGLVGVVFATGAVGTVGAQAQDPVDANGNRIVGGPGANSGTVFLGEEDIATDKGVFRGVQPDVFTDTNGNMLSVTNGRVNPNNAITTYTVTVGGTTRTLDVREPRIQALFVIDALSNERLDFEDPVIRHPSPGDPFNTQFAIDYNYFTSTSVDTDSALTQSGFDVTPIYLESTRDRALDAGGPFTSLDERRRVYDALFNFDIDDTGEYTFTATPRTGGNRPDGREVGFGFRGVATDSIDIRVADLGPVGIELDDTEANQGDRVDFSITGLFESQGATLTLEEEDFRYGGFGSGEFGELVTAFNQNGNTIGGDNPIEFVTNSFRQVDETAATGLIFRATDDFNDPGISPPGERLALETAGVDENDLVIFDTETLADVSVYRVGGNGIPVEITDQVLGPGTLNLVEGTFDDVPGPDLNRFAGSVAGTPPLTLERSYGVIVRDEGESDGQIDTENLDDVSVDIEVFGSRGTDEGEGIEARSFEVPRTHEGMFRNDEAFDDDDDEQTLDVEEVDITIDSPGDTYVPGTEVTLSGSITGTTDDVVILTRDRDNYFHVTTETTDRRQGDYEETNFVLDSDAVTDEAQDILGQPGNYGYGVIDGVDVDIIQALNTGTEILGDDGLNEREFNQGSGTQKSIRVVSPSLEGRFRTFDGTVFDEDGVDVRGTLVGPREFLTFLIDDRGNIVVEEFSADDADGEIDDEVGVTNLTNLTDGTIQASILSPGRDRELGNGSFRIDQSLQAATGLPAVSDATIPNFIRIAEALGETTRTQEQVREILLNQTIEQPGSDDLIVTEEFRLLDDSLTSITDIVPAGRRDDLSGINPIEVGETMVVRGTTNRNPDDATIIVEAEEGPTQAQLGTGIADEWASDGEVGAGRPGGVWSAELEVDEEVEPGEYIIRADDGDRIDERTVEIVPDSGGGGASIDNIQTSLPDTDGDGVPDQVQIDVTVSDVSSGQTTVELGESDFDVDVSPTNTGQEQFVTPQDTDVDGTNEAVEFVGLGSVSTTYTVVADLSGQADGDTGTVTVELGGGATSSTTYTVEEATGPLDPNNPFGDSGNNPVDRSTVIDRVVEWNLNGEINGTSFTRSEIIDFVVEWNLAS